MHEVGHSEAETPQRCRSELVGGGLVEEFGFCGLGDTVSCAHVVQQEVAVGMDDLVPQELRDSIGSSIDPCSWAQRLVSCHMADCTADFSEEHFAGLGGGSCCEIHIPRRRGRVTDFFYQTFQFSFPGSWIRTIEGSRAVTGCVGGIFVWVQSVANAEFIT